MPQVAIKESDIVGKWEHIDLSYKYAEQRTAVKMEFAADNTITSGPWKGGFSSHTHYSLCRSWKPQDLLG